ncbi:addiction module protein [Solimicrobium silvestre]|uniref:Putative addiction module component n=1 Tax=Solimicrobium silvestre TaxID=2099400 RepID=A0A2S9H0F3_9BURK|nr:addiction module protein [Solimicrobium silvestre]PRC93438.1 putative addiction module component [Solimicrobium silvestre]
MFSNIESLETEALCLPVEQRANLVKKLIANLDAEPAIEAAWVSEVLRRHAEIEAGTVALLPGTETMARLRTEFQ